MPVRETTSTPLGIHELCDWLRERVRVGIFVPGQRLIEADITRDTGAPRSRVREALRRLETEGLITIEEFRGASVKRITWDEVRQIYRTRMALEGLAAREFAAAEDPDRKQRLAEIQEEMNRWESTGDHDRFAKLNGEWHRLIIAGSRNEYVSAFLERLVIPVYRLLFSTFYTATRIDGANADHRRITKAICEGNPDEAEAAMREHINNGLEALSEIDSHFAR